MTGQAKLDEVSAGIDFGFVTIETKWRSDATQKSAAWMLAVELLTRVATQELSPDHGNIREALNSLQALFGVAREVLKTAGPDAGVGRDTVGGTTFVVLNKVLRPFLAEWHPRLLEWEAMASGTQKRERDWPQEKECREKLMKLQAGLFRYATELAELSGAKK